MNGNAFQRALKIAVWFAVIPIGGLVLGEKIPWQAIPVSAVAVFGFGLLLNRLANGDWR
jgi:hypothetical protein